MADQSNIADDLIGPGSPTGRMGTRNITLDMSPDLIHASKPIIRLLIDADVIFFWQYSAEPQKIVIETADLPPTASNTGGHGGILNAALIWSVGQDRVRKITGEIAEVKQKSGRVK